MDHADGCAVAARIGAPRLLHHGETNRRVSLLPFGAVCLSRVRARSAIARAHCYCWVCAAGGEVQELRLRQRAEIHRKGDCLCPLTIHWPVLWLPQCLCCSCCQDLHRTFPENVVFESSQGEGPPCFPGGLLETESLIAGIAMLRRILGAYSVRNPVVGYW